MRAPGGRAFAPAVGALVVGVAVALWAQGERPPTPSVVERAPDRPRVASDAPGRGAEGAPAPRTPPPPAVVDAALQDHAKAAAPRWRRAASILAHSDQAHLPVLAASFAERMDEAAEGLPPDRRQELVAEERQLLNHLRARYEGFAPLMAELDALDESLGALEALGAEPVASPPPRR